METNNTLIKFCGAWVSLGKAVQEQVTAVVIAHETPEFEDVVCQQNPSALQLALLRLAYQGGELKREGNYDAHAILEALKAAGETLVTHQLS